MEKICGMYHVNNQANSYGKGVELAITFFDLFNGKINPLFPARCLMFGHLPDSAWGVTIGDIVQLDMHKIMQGVSRFEGSSEEKVLLLKGLILYTITHELFHLEQDMDKYFRLSNDETEVRKLIEDSCHCATTSFLVGLKKFHLLPMDIIPEFDYYRPMLQTFTGWSEMDVDRYAMNLKSYYRITNPYHKVMWLANGYIMGNFSIGLEPDTIAYEFLTRSHSLMASIYIGKKLYRSGYIAYMHKLTSPRSIMDLINPLILLNSQGFCGSTHVSSVTNDHFPGTEWITVEAEVSEPFYWQIVEQLPSDEQPIPPII